MTEIKQSHGEFIAEFRAKLLEKRDQLLAFGLDVDNEDIGVFLTQVNSYLRDNPTDEILLPLWRQYENIIGDLYWSSPHVISQHPFGLTFTYKGVAIGSRLFGPEIYHNVYAPMRGFVDVMADSYLVPAHCIGKYLGGDKDARSALFGFFSFQNARSWTALWAKLDFLKKCFPKCYDKMMEDGEFLSLEEIEEKRKETGK